MFDPVDEAVSFNYIIMEHFDLTRQKLLSLTRGFMLSAFTDNQLKLTATSVIQTT
jgi:hypothetical protein